MWCTKCASDSHVKAQLRLRDHHSFFLRCFRVQVKKKQYVRRLLVKVKKKKTEKANLRREKKKKKKTHTQGEQEEKKKMLNKAVTTVQSVATYSVSGIEHGGDYVSLNTTRVEATKRRTEKKKKGSRRKALPYSNKTAVLFVVACFLLLLCLCVAVALSCSFDSCSATTWHGKKKNERKTLKQKNVRDSSSSQVTVSHHTNRKKKKLTRRRIRWEMGIPP